MKKKIIALFLCTALTAAFLSGCRETGSKKLTEVSEFNYENDIAVISREDGSGTRGAFTELFGIEQKNEAGEKIDNTTLEAAVTNNTSVMMTAVANDKYAIGYISLGSLNSTVKAVRIDDADATVENIKNGSYAISRPFNLAVKEPLNDAAQDFLNYILSADGQTVIEENGYIKIDDEAAAFKSNGAEGKVVVAGSSSVTPVMEKLKEAFESVNGKIHIEINTSDSSTGISSVLEGSCDLGMASRALKDSEAVSGAAEIMIAKDGIAVIVNNENPIDELSAETVKNIYIGEILTWSEI